MAVAMRRDQGPTRMLRFPSDLETVLRSMTVNSSGVLSVSLLGTPVGPVIVNCMLGVSMKLFAFLTSTFQVPCMEIDSERGP